MKHLQFLRMYHFGVQHMESLRQLPHHQAEKDEPERRHEHYHVALGLHYEALFKIESFRVSFKN